LYITDNDKFPDTESTCSANCVKNIFMNLYYIIFDEWSQKWIFYKTDYIDIVLCHVVI